MRTRRFGRALTASSDSSLEEDGDTDLMERVRRREVKKESSDPELLRGVEAEAGEALARPANHLAARSQASYLAIDAASGSTTSAPGLDRISFDTSESETSV
jgi:hypothetical protein